MKVLVTGAAGFLGNYVIRELLDRNVDVIAADLKSDKTVSKFDWYGKVKYVCKNTGFNGVHLYKELWSPDKLIHLAWAGLPNYSSMHHIEDNLMGSYRFISYMIGQGLKDVTVTGTCAEYGLEGPVSEDMDTRPCSPYSIAKDSLRRFLEALKATHKFDLKWVRLFYLYGEGQGRSSILSKLDDAIDTGLEYFDMSDGEQLRDYISVEKAARFLVDTSLRYNFNGILNCGSGIPISIRRLVEKHIKKRKSSIKLGLGKCVYSYTEPMAFWADMSKAGRVDESYY